MTSRLTSSRVPREGGVRGKGFLKEERGVGGCVEPDGNRERLQGYIAHKKHPPHWDHQRSLGIGLLWDPTGGVFLMSEVPLYGVSRRGEVQHTRHHDVVTLQ